MKCCFILSHINKSTQWLWYSQELKKRKIDHFYIIISDSNTCYLVNDLERENIKVFLLSHKSFSSHGVNLLKTFHILRKEKPDVVHTSLPYGNLIGQVSAWLSGIKNRITTCENSSWANDFTSKKQKIIDKITFRLSKKIIATCESSKEYLHEHWGINADKIKIVGQVLKLEIYRNLSIESINELKKQLGIHENDFVIGMIARFEFWKGHSYVIQAINELKTKIPNLKLVLLGSKGPEFDNIMSSVRIYNIENIVSYHGFIDAVPEFLHSINIHIHVPTNKFVETYGLNIIEGMACGCAQILTKSGIAVTTAHHMENCLIVDYCSVNEIVNAVIMLYQNSELREKIGKNAKNYAEENFKISVKVDNSMAIYKNN